MLLLLIYLIFNFPVKTLGWELHPKPLYCVYECCHKMAFVENNEMKYLFELSSFTNTSYCETIQHLTPVFFVLSLPYIHYYFTFNES
jgi:hypothetical protein